MQNKILGEIRRTNTILYCRKWESTLVFYRDVLELPVRHKTDWLVEFQLSDDSYLSIAEAAHTSIESADGKGITLSWQVGSLEHAYRHASGIGIEVSPIKTVWGSRVFYFHDPEGHRIEIWER